MAVLLDYQHVEVSFNGDPVVHDVSFQLHPGEILGLVGESGSGKSTLLKAAMGLLGSSGMVTRGDIWFEGKSLPDVPPKEMRRICGEKIGMIFQDCGASLSPTRTIGEQIIESMAAHRKVDVAEAKRAALELFEKLHFQDGERIWDSYPFELSGGMRQRVMIAMALACEPDILIADEPTTALDVTIQAQILELMQDLQKKLGMAVILVTHDLGVIADMCDNIIVMYGGRICERGTAREIFYNPKHEYTKGLLRSIPNVNNMKKKLVPIAGTPINMLNLPAGCAFCTRCDAAMKICLSEHPEEMAINENHRAACWINVRDQLMAEGGEQNV